jgi:hypothetical protein
MMNMNPQMVHLLADARIRDALRDTEDERLIRAAFGPRRNRRWQLPAGLLGRWNPDAQQHRAN